MWSRWVSGAGVSGALAQLLLAERVLLREDVLTERPAAEQLARRKRHALLVFGGQRPVEGGEDLERGLPIELV